MDGGPGSGLIDVCSSSFFGFLVRSLDGLAEGLSLATAGFWGAGRRTLIVFDCV
jgi:hypothetical protein